MPYHVHPYAPKAQLYRVRMQHQSFVAQRFGVMYAHACLSRRHCDTGAKRYAPVSLTPGDVPVFCWPAIELNLDWLERVGTRDQGLENVLELRRA